MHEPFILIDMLLYVLGTSQDAGYPQVGCKNICCQTAWDNPELKKFPSSIAIINKEDRKYWLIDITPEIKTQIQMIDKFDCSVEGIFIRHAHIGHYMGLINLGLEVMNLKNIPVYVMPKMKEFIINNTLLNQLVQNNNIKLSLISDGVDININDNFTIQAFDVPHRNELSETVGYKIIGQKKSAIYMPDIDSWDRFEKNLFKLINNNDILFLDGTFYQKSEIKTRDIKKIPHPSIVDTMDMLMDLSDEDKQKIHFIHFNHTNDAIREGSEAYNTIIDSGFSISRENQKFNLS